MSAAKPKAGTVSGARDAMLRQINAALAVKPTGHAAPEHEAPHATPHALPERLRFADFLPAVTDRLAVFSTRCEALRTELVTTDTRSQLVDALRTIVDQEPGAIAFHDHPLVTPLVRAMNRPLVETAGGHRAADLERCVVGVTACTALIAQTGSVLITSEADGGRSLSVIAHHHVVIATKPQLLADLPSVYAAIDPSRASMLSIISGPSRTGDIERILVLGAHGPRKLTVLLSLADD